MSGTSSPIMVGAVAYHERVVPIWEKFAEYFSSRGVPTDYVLFSNYEKLVDALMDGRIDIAWNTNTAYVKAVHSGPGSLQILGMRDVDTDYASLIVTKKTHGFQKANELKGKRFALGSRDSGHAAILPLYYLKSEGFDAEAECELVRFDTDLGKHGDTGDSEIRVVRAVAEGDADAGALGAPTWARLRAEANPATEGLEVQWKSPTYFHCNFTALPSFPADRAKAWQQALLAMDHNDPDIRGAMDLEGVKRWFKGDDSGYEALELAMEEQGYL